VLTSYGPGAMLDLPEQAGVVACVDDWRYEQKGDGFIEEPRLQAMVNRHFANKEVGTWRLRQPPEGDPKEAKPYVAAYRFPEWFVVERLLSEGELQKMRVAMAKRGPVGPTAERFAKGGGGFTARPLVNQRSLDKGLYVDTDGPSRKAEKHAVVPVRFAQSCLNNHLSDVRWGQVAHYDHRNPPCMNHRLVLLEDGSSGALDRMLVACQGCGAHMALSRLADEKDGQGNPLGPCKSVSVWLGSDRPNDDQACLSKEGKPMLGKLIVRNAANQHFPQILRVISLPEGTPGGVPPEDSAVDAVWETIQKLTVEKLELLGPELPPVKAQMDKVGLPAFLAAFQARLLGRDALAPAQGGEDGGPKLPELRTLLAAGALPRADRRRDRSLSWVAERMAPSKEAGFKPKWRNSGLIDRVVLVHRMREVAAMVGFTRFDPVMPDIQGELDVEVPSAPIYREERFVPAVETWGEGVALFLSVEAVEAWAKRPETRQREAQLLRGQSLWKQRHQRSHITAAPLEYLLLHSLSHLVIQALALRCGYPAGSLKERIYAVPGEGYGLLIYTSASDAAGTMGGLVRAGQKMGEVLEEALAMGQVCSNDPLCALHQPDDPEEDRNRHGAACHGCAMIPEPSCERLNEDLDRALVVPTMDSEGQGAAYFPLF
jgi:hypothetical protein